MNRHILFSTFAGFMRLFKSSSLRAIAKQSSSDVQLKIDLDCFTSFAKTVFFALLFKLTRVPLFCFGLLIASTVLAVEPQPLRNITATVERDPTQPAVVDSIATGSKKEAKPSYLLQSIIISSTRRLALINSNFVRVGDKIADATVEMIDKNSVILSLPGRKLTLYLFSRD